MCKTKLNVWLNDAIERHYGFDLNDKKVFKKSDMQSFVL